MRTHFPRLFAQNALKILPGIISLISTSQASDKNRLKIQVSNNHSDVEKRMKIFAIIGSTLELYLTYNYKCTNDKKCFPQYTFENGYCLNTKERPLYTASDYDFGGLSLTPDEFTDEDIATIGNVNNNDGDDDKWSNFISQCLPLLCATWVEIGPSVFTEGSQKDGKILL